MTTQKRKTASANLQKEVGFSVDTETGFGPFGSSEMSQDDYSRALWEGMPKKRYKNRQQKKGQ